MDIQQALFLLSLSQAPKINTNTLTKSGKNICLVSQKNATLLEPNERGQLPVSSRRLVSLYHVPTIKNKEHLPSQREINGGGGCGNELLPCAKGNKYALEVTGTGPTYVDALMDSLDIGVRLLFPLSTNEEEILPLNQMTFPLNLYSNSVGIIHSYEVAASRETLYKPGLFKRKKSEFDLTVYLTPGTSPTCHTLSK